MPTTSKKNIKKHWLQDTNKSCAEHKDNLHKNARSSKGMFVYYVLSQFYTPAEPLRVWIHFLDSHRYKFCLFILVITVCGATKGCATKLGNSRATNRICYLNDNTYVKRKGRQPSWLPSL